MLAVLLIFFTFISSICECIRVINGLVVSIEMPVILSIEMPVSALIGRHPNVSGLGMSEGLGGREMM